MACEQEQPMNERILEFVSHIQGADQQEWSKWTKKDRHLCYEETPPETVCIHQAGIKPCSKRCENASKQLSDLLTIGDQILEDLSPLAKIAMEE